MLSTPFRSPARLVLPLAVLVLTTPLAAQQAEPAQQQREHVVRRGDTLWDLARFYLGNPFLWPRIFDVNRSVVEDPHWIFPAERLLIPPVSTATVPAAPLQPIGREWQPAPVAAPGPVEAVPPADEAGAAVALDLRRSAVQVAEYQAAPWLSATAEGDVFGRVVRLSDPAADNDRIVATMRPGDGVYVGSFASAPPAAGDSLLVVQFGRRIGDRGRIVEPVAVLAVESVTGGVATARVARQFGAARVGDAVLRLGAPPALGQGEPQPVANGLEAQLLHFVGEEPLYGTTDLGFVSAGSADGVGIGDEFVVYVPARPAQRRSTEMLPATEVATVRVVRVTERAATVRVVAVNSTALRPGLPVRMIRRMP